MEIENYSEAAQGNPNSKLIATFDLVLPEMHLTLRRWKVVKSAKSESGWFACPPSFKSGEDDQGKLSFASYVEVGEKRRHEFNRGLHEAVKPFVVLK